MTGRFDKQLNKEEYQKWDYITLSDFRSASLGKVFSFGWIWFLSLVSVSVYAADTYTAVNLLVFGRWTSQIQPAIPVNISRWIFAGCILLSFVLCIYDWVRAVTITRRNNVAECYLDPMTRNLQSMRVTKKGQGWRRFLVFAALTKSKKGADYVALFVHFQFKGAIRMLLAESPRQVINGITLYSVTKAQLLPTGQNSGNPFVQFIKNVEVLAQVHTEQATILFTMLFTFVIWVFSFLSFLVACIAWVFFLWYYIPREDGTLSKYCRRKIEKRLERIVNDRAKRALERVEAQSQRDEEKGMTTSGQALDALVKRPTLPITTDADSDYQSSVLKGTDPLSRSGSSSWRPPQSSHSGKSFASDQQLLRQPTLPSIGPDPTAKPLPGVSQVQTQDPADSRKPTLPQIDLAPTGAGRPNGPFRTATQSSAASNYPLLAQTVDRGFTESPSPLDEDAPLRQPARQNTLGRQPLPASRLASSTPYPGDDTIMGRQNTTSQRTPAPLAGSPPNRPLPAYPNQRQRRPTNPSNTRQQPLASADIELQPQQPPSSLRVGPPSLPQQQQQQQPSTPLSLRAGPPQPQPARSLSTSAAQWPLTSQQDQVQSEPPRQPPPATRNFNPPARSATTGPYYGNTAPLRTGTAPPSAMRNDGYGPPLARTAQGSEAPWQDSGPGRMMRPPPSMVSTERLPPRRGPGPGLGPAPRPRAGPGSGLGQRPGPGPTRNYGSSQGPYYGRYES